MRANRRFLYWGVFLVAIGSVLVATDLRAIDADIIGDAMRLWPLAVVAIGLGLVLRRTRFGVPATMLAAAVPGLVLGGSLALAPRIAVDCGASGAATTLATHEGTFDGPARVTVTSGCGALVVDTAPGNAWRFEAGDSADRVPNIEASSRALSIDAGGRGSWHVFDSGRDTWHLTLPTSDIENLALIVNAGQGRIGLPGAQIGNLRVTTNAAETTVDLSGAAVANLTGAVDFGKLSIRLEDADLVGSLKVNAAALQVCLPSEPNELGLRVHHTGVLSGTSVNGEHQSGGDWQSPDYASAAHHADLNVNVNLGSVEINPIGGCK